MAEHNDHLLLMFEDIYTLRLKVAEMCQRRPLKAIAADFEAIYNYIVFIHVFG